MNSVGGFSDALGQATTALPWWVWAVGAFGVWAAARITWKLRLPSKLRVVQVIDGDTLQAVGSNGKGYRLRLWGVDAPERGQPGSEEAAFALRKACRGWVDVRWRGRDRYRRYLVSLGADEGDVATGLVRQGLVFPLGSAWLRFCAMGPRAKRQGVWAYGGRRPWHSWRRRLPLLAGLEAGYRRRARARRRK